MLQILLELSVNDTFRISQLSDALFCHVLPYVSFVQDEKPFLCYNACKT
jgi:hypothetical protein